MIRVLFALLIIAWPGQSWAFPSTSVLDSGSGGDGNLTGNWSTPMQLSTNPMQRLSSQFAATTTGVSDAYWNVGTFSTTPGVEAFTTLATVNGTERFFLSICIQNPNSGAENFYDLQINRATNVWRLNRIDAGLSNNIHADFTQAVSGGDGAGIANLSGTIEVWYRSGGIWTRLFTQVDNTYTSGYIGMGILNLNNRGTNFGGGTAVVGGFFRNQGDLTGVGTGRLRKDPLQYRPLRRGIDYDFANRVKVPHLW